MEQFKKFLNLFFSRLSLPLNIIHHWLYNILPIKLKKFINIELAEISLLVLLLLLILINYLTIKVPLKSTSLQVSYFPYSAKNRLNLAQVYWQNNNLSQAYLEFNYAKFLMKKASFINQKGRDLINLNNRLETMIKKPELLKHEIEYLESLVKANINSRDIFLKLSLLYFNLWQEDKSLYYWQKAYYQDPNNEEVLKVGKLIGNN